MITHYIPDLEGVFDRLIMERAPSVVSYRKDGQQILKHSHWKAVRSDNGITFSANAGGSVEVKMYGGFFAQQEIGIGESIVRSRTVFIPPIITYSIESALLDGALGVLRENGRTGELCTRMLNQAKAAKNSFARLSVIDKKEHLIRSNEWAELYRLGFSEKDSLSSGQYEILCPIGRRAIELFGSLTPLVADRQAASDKKALEAVAERFLKTHMSWLSGIE